MKSISRSLEAFSPVLGPTLFCYANSTRLDDTLRFTRQQTMERTSLLDCSLLYWCDDQIYVDSANSSSKLCNYSIMVMTPLDDCVPSLYRSVTRLQYPSH